jgi:putative transposase
MRSRYRVGNPAAPHFFTCTVIGWLPVFTRPETMDIILDSWKFLINNQRMTVFGYVILENHLHFVASSPDLSKEVGDFKSYTARCIIDLLQTRRVTTLLDQLKLFKDPFKVDREYQLWQEGSHPQEITGDEMMLQKLEYIHLNPVKRGFVDEPAHWRYSSARNYEGKPGLLPVQTKWW